MDPSFAKLDYSQSADRRTSITSHRNKALEMKTLEIRLTTSTLAGHRYDFFISGRPLRQLLPRPFRQMAPRLGGEYQPVDSETRDRLLLELPGDLPSGRVTLYICPVCGDFGCGVIGAFVVRDGHAVAWRQFAYEASHLPPVTIENLGPFRFNEVDYRKSISTAVFPPSS